MSINYKKLLSTFDKTVEAMGRLKSTDLKTLNLSEFQELVKSVDRVNRTDPKYNYRFNCKKYEQVLLYLEDWEKHGAYPGPVVACLGGGIVVCEAVPDPESAEDLVAVTAPASKAAAYLGLIERYIAK